jgi:hypothetical protein
MEHEWILGRQICSYKTSESLFLRLHCDFRGFTYQGQRRIKSLKKLYIWPLREYIKFPEEQAAVGGTLEYESHLRGACDSVKSDSE